jgi:hypothetical protein
MMHAWLVRTGVKITILIFATNHVVFIHLEPNLHLVTDSLVSILNELGAFDEPAHARCSTAGCIPRSPALSGFFGVQMQGGRMPIA